MEYRRRLVTLAVCSALSLLGSVGGVASASADDLSLSVVSNGPLGPFVPGVAADYSTTEAAIVTAPAGTVLTIADTSGIGVPGELFNDVDGSSLYLPLEASGSSSATGATGSSLSPIDADPLALVTYSQAAISDPVTIDLQQTIAATEPLRTGMYEKTLTLTLTEGP